MEKRPHRFAVSILPTTPKSANGIEEAKTDARALPLRQNNQSARPRFPKSRQRRDGHMSHRLIAHKSDVVCGGHHVRHPQIVMRLKKRPKSPVGLEYVEIDSGALKTPPCPAEIAGCGIENPIGGEPVNNIIMT